MDRSLGANPDQEDSMSDLTRRGFVKNSAAATAGMTVIGALIAEQAEAHSAAHGPHGAHPVVAYVRDPAKGEISVMAGDREVKVRDRQLAARLVRAVR
jgi:hypothetical protein